MDRETTGKVLSVTAQRWLKINTKPVRVLGTDGAIYPHVIKIEYHVDGRAYTKRKWISAGKFAPSVGSSVKVIYDEQKPSKGRVQYADV